jgi:cell division septal protein FtsQ
VAVRQVVVRNPPLRAVDRAVAWLLLVLMALGSLALWTAVPLATLRFGVHQFESPALNLIAGLILVPLAMILFGMVLMRLNVLYLRVTGNFAYDPDEDRPRRLRGPLEPLLVWSLLVALVAISYWFFFLAEGPGHLGP